MILVQISDFVGEYQLATGLDDSIYQAIIDKREKNNIQRLLGPDLSLLLIAYIQSPPANITAGPLVLDNQYTVVTYEAGDDFSNQELISGTVNTVDSVFKAITTTPTDYSNGSELSVTTPRYDNLINPFYLEQTGYTNFLQECFANSHGLKDMLLCDIYYQIILETQQRASRSGIVAGAAENGYVLSPASALRAGEIKWNTDGLDTWEAIRWRCKVYEPDVYPDYRGTIERPRYSL